MSEPIRIDHKGHAYEVPEPAGERALVLFNMAMAVCLKAGILDVLDGLDDKPEKERNAAFGLAGVKLAGSLDGHSVARATLAGGKVDGTEITTANYPSIYASPGRYIEPHIVALMVWLRAGFFGVPTTSGAASSPGPKDRPGKA